MPICQYRNIENDCYGLLWKRLSIVKNIQLSSSKQNILLHGLRHDETLHVVYSLEVT